MFTSTALQKMKYDCVIFRTTNDDEQRFCDEIQKCSVPVGYPIFVTNKNSLKTHSFNFHNDFKNELFLKDNNIMQ